MKEGLYMPANDKAVVVIEEWVAKPENDVVVANCDHKQEMCMKAPQVARGIR